MYKTCKPHSNTSIVASLIPDFSDGDESSDTNSKDHDDNAYISFVYLLNIGRTVRYISQWREETNILSLYLRLCSQLVISVVDYKRNDDAKWQCH